ncbi:Transcription factor CBF/NF-Y/archaeal histone domain-containing protein [Dioscorea alata]|uniref:Transcription factor CBF/NF-Y/archaeal histone domain-containing protein n=1 Tax=Dioscorea alata TaxID=55571 RepID=A0ACB7W2M6_DIOAL|nr:Transcription factor CBF/NF-Y/archaeal histone domain-containing protein [Dioscorea alata]
MAAIEGLPEIEEEEDREILNPLLPMGRVKKILKMDRDIKKVNSEALHLITLSTQLFIEFLAERSRTAAVEKKRKVIKVEHLRSAARNHPPTSDFLLDCLPKPAQAKPSASATSRPLPDDAPPPLPPGARRIDDFFSKPSAGKQGTSEDGAATAC